jgi:hypothetical protein
MQVVYMEHVTNHLNVNACLDGQDHYAIMQFAEMVAMKTMENAGKQLRG